ncbi:hypothetical protein OIU76_018767 [Salix suchowensis]|uniref:Uncharacterized protein n=1 Tax=Salix suchowensis TaxID=1278906 RepID=A0ABQ9C5W5_9ROSI|nr:keratin-associated protein [Salix suchowensis]KAJ6309237.1 hypothetical protein OIU76_018767 [Salix suchowensis]KAJ6394924.1 hypothetical protein OIU77_024023 [Salix suchowensis]
MGDIDCNFGDCDCDCDPDCCCCCCPDFDQCCDGCCSWDGDHSLCCCIICIGGDDGRRNHRDSSCLPWLCCWNYDSRRRTKSFSDDQWRSGPKQNGMKKEEKEKKKEPGSRQATYGTCYTCHGPIDISQRYRHWHDSSDYQCSRCSSTPPYPLDPPASIQQFHKLDQERPVSRKGMY